MSANTDDSRLRLLLCTAPNRETAEALAHALVTEKLAACVTVLPNITSIYRWQGEIQVDEEVQLIIKTVPSQGQAITDFVLQHHPYDVPEVIALDTASASRTYADWVRTAVS